MYYILAAIRAALTCTKCVSQCLCHSILLSYLTVTYSPNAYTCISLAHDITNCAEPQIFAACLCLYACTCTIARHTSIMPRVGIFSLIKLGHSSLPLGAAADGEPRQPSNREDFEGHWARHFSSEPPTSISASSAPAVLQRLLSLLLLYCYSLLLWLPVGRTLPDRPGRPVRILIVPSSIRAQPWLGPLLSHQAWHLHVCMMRAMQRPRRTARPTRATTAALATAKTPQVHVSFT